MFLSDSILHHGSPLAKIWLAAHYDRKLTKRDIVHVSIPNSVKAILDTPSDPRLLRLSGPLLLGVTRIYARKVKYLLDTATDAKLAILLAFKPNNSHLNLLSNTIPTINNHMTSSGYPTSKSSTHDARSHLTLAETLAEFDLLLVPTTSTMMDPNSNADWSTIPSTPTRPLARSSDITLVEAALMNNPAPPTPTSAFTNHINRLDFNHNREEDEDIPMLDLGLDLGLDEPMDIEVGRRASIVNDSDTSLLLNHNETISVDNNKLMTMDDTNQYLDLGLKLDDLPELGGGHDDASILMNNSLTEISTPNRDTTPMGDLLFPDEEKINHTNHEPDDDLQTLEAIVTSNAVSRKRRRHPGMDPSTELDHLTLQRLVTDASNLLRPTMPTVPCSDTLAHWSAIGTSSTYGRVMLGLFAPDAINNIDNGSLPNDNKDQNDDIAVVIAVRDLSSRKRTRRDTSPTIASLGLGDTGFPEFDGLNSHVQPDVPIMNEEDENPIPIAGLDNLEEIEESTNINQYPQAPTVEMNDWNDTNIPRGKSPTDDDNPLLDSMMMTIPDEEANEEEVDDDDQVQGLSTSARRTLRELSHYRSKISSPSKQAEDNNNNNNNNNTVGMQQLLSGCSRTHAARTFYELLLLGTRNMIKVSQQEPYGDIMIGVV